METYAVEMSFEGQGNAESSYMNIGQGFADRYNTNKAQETPVTYLHPNPYYFYTGGWEIKQEKSYEVNLVPEVVVNNDGKYLEATQEHVTKDNEPSYKCPVCNKTFYLEMCLQLHKTQLHQQGNLTKDKPYKCDICKKSYWLERCLQVHKKEHSDRNPLQCGQCGKLFSQKSTLHRHEKTVHSDGKRYPCGLCEKSYSREYYLADHMKQHNGEKPHSCKICFESFRTRNILQRHLSVHKPGGKPFKCDLCDKSYTKREYLINHTNQHKLTPF